jgi:hypothetical protein
VLYSLLAALVVVLHLSFVVFATLGGLLVLRWPRAAWLHVPALVWGAFVELDSRICPLTPLENALRRAAGRAGYEGDFVTHYLVPILYPVGLTVDVQFALGFFLIVLNAIIYAFVWQRGRRARQGTFPASSE